MYATVLFHFTFGLISICDTVDLKFNLQVSNSPTYIREFQTFVLSKEFVVFMVNISYLIYRIYHAAISREKKKGKLQAFSFRESYAPAVYIHADAGFPIFASINP